MLTIESGKFISIRQRSTSDGRDELFCTQLPMKGLREVLSLLSLSQPRKEASSPTFTPCSPVPNELNLDPLATEGAGNIPHAPGPWGHRK